MFNVSRVKQGLSFKMYLHLRVIISKVEEGK